MTVMQLLKKGILKHLSLQHDKPHVFVRSQWQNELEPNVVYLIYRWIVAAIFLTVFLISVINISQEKPFSESVKWLIYLTDWGFTVCTIQAIFSAIMLTVCFVREQLHEVPPKCYQLYWICNVIATDVAFIITVLYWSLLFKPNTKVQLMDFLMHGNNSVVMFIDLFVVAHPVRPLHCCYSIAFGVCYLVFSVIYYAAGGTDFSGKSYIYYVLDWSKPLITFGISFGVLCLVVAIHLIVWGLHKVKLWIHYKKCKPQRTDDNNSENKA